MASRRMFAKGIVQGSKFLKMPVSSRELYFQLGMSADDDGVVEAWNVMKITNATEDDLRVLVSKGYIKILNDDLLTYLLDWKTNNYIRGDRYHASIYKDLILELTDGDTQNDNQMATIGIPNDNHCVTEVSIGKINKRKINKKKNFPPTVEEVAEYCRERGNGIDAQQFVDYYDARSWYSGKTKLTNWKKCVNTWERKKGFVYKPQKEPIVSDAEDEWTDEEFFKAVDSGFGEE